MDITFKIKVIFAENFFLTMYITTEIPMVENMGIRIIFLPINWISANSWYTNNDLIDAKISTINIRNETIIADFLSPRKRIKIIHRMITIASEIIIGVKISPIGISCMLSINRNETGNKAKIKWWNPNLENNIID